jgi:tRNA threonylcarbamoyladenosine biosynthesis protein TsaE
MVKEFITKSAEETQKLGEILAKKLLKKRVGKTAVILALEGDLGGGKTVFAQGLARGLGSKEQITSPSFVLIKKYRLTPSQPSFYIKSASSTIAPQLRRGGRKRGLENFYHLDCYRLTKVWQLQELGFEEIICDPKNLVVIEWAEKVEEILPKDKIVIKFEWVGENRRKITII